MELRQLKYFAAVCETLHYGKAAEKLHIAEQPLSFQIKKLEEELGYKLFERTTRSVRITPAGSALLSKLTDAFRSLEQGVEQGRMIAEGKNAKIRIVYNSMTINMVIPHIIQQFKKEHPDIDIILTERNSPELETAIINDEADVGFIALYWEDFDGLCCKTIFEEDSVAAIPKGWDLSKHRIHSLSELKDQPFITYSREARRKSFEAFNAVCRLSGFVPNIVQEAESDIAVLGLVASGLGIALVPDGYRNIFSNAVSYHVLKKPRVTLKICLIWKEGNLSETACSLVETANNCHFDLLYSKSTNEKDNSFEVPFKK